MISIRTLSLLAYFTYIFIDTIIYDFGSTPWPFGIFWMVGRVIADPFLDLLSLCGVVPQVSILVKCTSNMVTFDNLDDDSSPDIHEDSPPRETGEVLSPPLPFMSG
jgi:hypothetical protein